MTYNPEQWLESAIREIKEYAENGFDDAVYDVIMEFPGPILDNSDMPLKKTVVHFEVDDGQDRIIGIGENVFEDNYDSVAHTVNPQYAGMHTLNFDVGIWASADSGGTTARMRAKQILYDLFGAPSGHLAFHEFTDGGDGRVEILNYTGGRFIRDAINDVPIYRMIDSQLIVRVFSRTKKASVATVASIEGIDQDPNLTILG